ncbi:MAG: hypothetical protein WAT37_17260 [Saprospiraceae bacterium]
MVTHCIKNLNEIKSFIYSISENQYTYQCDTLSGATIGQHVRHILEFYLCLLNGVHQGSINYDSRERNIQLETDMKFAIFTLNKMITNLEVIPVKNQIKLFGNYCIENNDALTIDSSIERELVYCLEHAIHHMALIKVATIDQGLSDILNENFGIAPSTIRNRRLACVQ